MNKNYVLSLGMAAFTVSGFPLSNSVNSQPNKSNSPGAVYTMNNSAAGNEVLMFKRSSDGVLAYAGSVATGGLGTDGGLGNQSGIALSDNGKWMLVVNAGSDEVSVLGFGKEGLHLVDKVWSGGSLPISVTAHGNLVYVLNGGGVENEGDNITGFVLNNEGSLLRLEGSTRPLSAESTAPAQVGFNSTGKVLVVTEKRTGNIDTYTVGINGLVQTHRVYASVGVTPFGFSFGHRNQLFVSEAFGGAPEASAVTSYHLDSNGELSVISPSVPTTETAACWLAVTKNGKFAYTTNTGSDTTTGFSIDTRGELHLLNEGGVTGLTGDAPIDMAFSQNSQYLYVLNGAGRSISGFSVNAEGGLISLGEVALPGRGNGLVAY